MLLLEAGGDDDSYDYDVPAFHARASEDDRYAWNFFVRHYADDARQRRDPKFRAAENGVLYPRCATLGGCTAHNAMILLYPHNSDWDNIAAITGDASWSSDNMHRYFTRLERCEYVSRIDAASRHGFDGWLATNVADPLLMVRDAFAQGLVKAMLRESFATLGRPFSRVLGRLASHFDPNDWRLASAAASTSGACSARAPIGSSCARGHLSRVSCSTSTAVPRVSNICRGATCIAPTLCTRWPTRRSGNKLQHAAR